MDTQQYTSVEDILSKFSETPPDNAPKSLADIEAKEPINDFSSKSVDDILNGLESTQEEPTGDPQEAPIIDEAKVVKKAKDSLDATELSSIQLLIENGKLQPWVNDKNEIILPTTKAELLELMDENLETINQNSYQEVQNQFYQTKSPVWQQLLKYSENARSLDEVAPLFSAMQNLESTQHLDPTNEDHQEYIIRQNGSIRGLDADTIDAEIEDLKERGKLQERAEKYKPGLDKYNEQVVQQELFKKQQEDQQKQYLLQSHYNNVVENIVNRKEIGGVKMKDADRQYIASTLVPDDQLGGLPIYTIIDNLLQSGDYDTLARISLLASNSKVHDSYYNTKNSNQVANDLQRKLRVANTQTAGSVIGEEYKTEPQKVFNWRDQSKQYL